MYVLYNWVYCGIAWAGWLIVLLKDTSAGMFSGSVLHLPILYIKHITVYFLSPADWFGQTPLDSWPRAAAPRQRPRCLLPSLPGCICWSWQTSRGGSRTLGSAPAWKQCWDIFKQTVITHTNKKKELPQYKADDFVCICYMSPSGVF